MKPINQIINIAKKLINLPYNQFHLNNYKQILWKYFEHMHFQESQSNLPIKLMSGNNQNAGITFVDCNTIHKKRIFIIGKGILFDSGGLNLKTGKNGSYGMHGDKAGMIIALTIAHYFKNNIIAYCPVTTNFIQTSQITPGDEISIGNKIVKITNTDAEGRLILAEALSNLNLNITLNDIVITIATLTGCVGLAIDKKTTGVFSPNNMLAALYLKASQEAKEYAWRLPLFDYMQDFYKKKIINNGEDKILAGASEGAMFIKQFVKYPNNWIHLDIAYSAFDKNQKATGAPIKSLINFIQKLQ